MVREGTGRVTTSPRISAEKLSQEISRFNKNKIIFSKNVKNFQKKREILEKNAQKLAKNARKLAFLVQKGRNLRQIRAKTRQIRAENRQFLAEKRILVAEQTQLLVKQANLKSKLGELQDKTKSVKLKISKDITPRIRQFFKDKEAFNLEASKLQSTIKIPIIEKFRTIPKPTPIKLEPIKTTQPTNLGKISSFVSDTKKGTSEKFQRFKETPDFQGLSGGFGLREVSRSSKAATKTKFQRFKASKEGLEIRGLGPIEQSARAGGEVEIIDLRKPSFPLDLFREGEKVKLGNVPQEAILLGSRGEVVGLGGAAARAAFDAPLGAFRTIRTTKVIRPKTFKSESLGRIEKGGIVEETFSLRGRGAQIDTEEKIIFGFKQPRADKITALDVDVKGLTFSSDKSPFAVLSAEARPAKATFSSPFELRARKLPKRQITGSIQDLGDDTSRLFGQIKSPRGTRITETIDILKKRKPASTFTRQERLKLARGERAPKLDEFDVFSVSREVKLREPSKEFGGLGAGPFKLESGSPFRLQPQTKLQVERFKTRKITKVSGVKFRQKQAFSLEAPKPKAKAKKKPKPRKTDSQIVSGYAGERGGGASFSQALDIDTGGKFAFEGLGSQVFGQAFGKIKAPPQTRALSLKAPSRQAARQESNPFTLQKPKARTQTRTATRIKTRTAARVAARVATRIKTRTATRAKARVRTRTAVRTRTRTRTRTRARARVTTRLTARTTTRPKGKAKPIAFKFKKKQPKKKAVKRAKPQKRRFGLTPTLTEELFFEERKKKKKAGPRKKTKRFTGLEAFRLR